MKTTNLKLIVSLAIVLTSHTAFSLETNTKEKELQQTEAMKELSIQAKEPGACAGFPWC